jgi:hypothetical protein
MPINVTCPSCNATLRAPDTAAGKKIKCPKCATICNVPAAQAPVEEVVEQVAAAPPPRRVEEERPRARDDEDRPRRRREEEEDEDDDRGRRRRRRRDAQESEPGTGLQIGLGIGSLVLGVIAMPFAFCVCLSFVSVPLASVGMLLGIVGLVVALLNQRRGLVLPIIGCVVNLLAGVVIAVAWIFFGVWMHEADRNVHQANLENLQRIEEDRKRREEAEKKEKQPPPDGELPVGPVFATWKTQSQNNLKMLALAMHSYHDTFKKFPPHQSAMWGKKGKLSWRVAILPFIEQGALYNQFNLDQDWDSPQNKALLDKMPAAFRSPNVKQGDENKTYYQVFTGPDTIFSGQATKMTGITDGTSNTFLIVEAKKPVDWTKPEDIPYTKAGKMPALGGIFAGNFNAAMADSSVKYIRREALESDIRAWITPNGGEAVGPPPD